jgi:transcription elongation factor Elf1
MTFLFKCRKCGKELEVTIKVVFANQIVELSEEVGPLPIAFKCPSCGEPGSVMVQPKSESAGRLTRLKLKNALKPSMN